MDDTLKTVLAVWGASISTILAIRTVIMSIRDRPKISITADLVYMSCSENDQTKGTKIELEGKGWNEIRIKLRVRNTGTQGLQIVSVYIHDSRGVHQIFPEDIPSVVEPRTQLETTIQKEWVDDTLIESLGVLDATGRRHKVPFAQVAKVVAESNSLPSEKKDYRHKQTGDKVTAFQVRDRVSVNAGFD